MPTQIQIQSPLLDDGSELPDPPALLAENGLGPGGADDNLCFLYFQLEMIQMARETRKN